jgi:transcriptional regulator with XRE-family HTH domain
LLIQPALSSPVTQIVVKKIAVVEIVAAEAVTDYSLRVPMTTPTLTQRFLTRVREEMARLELSQRDIAAFSGLSESKISKIMHGVLELGIEDAAKLCAAVSLSITEAVRDRGMEFCAEMTPTELRLLELWRKMSQPERDAYFQIMGGKVKLEGRRALPQRASRLRKDSRG